MTPDADTLAYSPEELCSRISTLTASMMSFWKHSAGWAPSEASALLDRSMLDWQSSLAASLSRWTDATSPGDLILAWANLGALVEGQLKLFLCVYYHDFASDVEGIKRRGQRLEPDVCVLNQLREFFVERIWDAGTNWNPYVQLVQTRRNAIHAFAPHEIGTFEEWVEALRTHLAFVRDVGGGLPYPDEQFEGLREA